MALNTRDLCTELTRAVRNEQEARGLARTDATSYTLGYMESMLASVIEGLPKSQQKRINDELVSRIIRR